MCRPVIQVLTLFQTKKCHFSHPFSDLPSKLHIRLQSWPLGNYVILTYTRIATKNDPFQIRIFLLLYSFGIEMIDTFINSRSSLKNHTQFQTKMGKVYTCFQTLKTAQKPYAAFGRHISTWLI